MEGDEIITPTEKTPSEEINSLDIGSATVENISVGGAPIMLNPNDVKFKVAYPKTWEGELTMPQGSTLIISKESAEQFTALGIGKIVK